MPPFKFCPRCGHEGLSSHKAKAIKCPACDFKYFHNNAVGAGVVIRCGDHVLFTERALEPARGLLDVPGGFVDYGETLEQAAIRETREEVGVQLKEVEYFASFPNSYPYADVLYHTCDVYFQARLPERPDVIAADETAACHWLLPNTINADKLAFESVKQLVKLLLRS